MEAHVVLRGWKQVNGPQRLLQRGYWQILIIDGKVWDETGKVKNDPGVTDRHTC